jgi:signal transduction histidine kinase
VSIEDDGVGFDKTDKTDRKTTKSVGLSNVRFRLEHTMNGMMSVCSSPGNGTTVTIMIPWKEANLVCDLYG